jgi:2-keto-4-pentenoate hydratase/2-oxohepta-3-ene-1,7-dioic acid hydratase in catechol pathway
MRLASFRGRGGAIRTGVLAAGRLADVSEAVAALPLAAESSAAIARCGIPEPAGGMLRLLHAGPAALEAVGRAAADARESVAVEEAGLLAPVPRPGKIVAVGRNYADHAKETGVDPFEKPRIIAKLPSSVAAPGAAVARPAEVSKLDFEAELAVVIGAFAHAIPRERALDCVAGYTLLNDLSAREFQFDVAPPQTTFAKSMDGFCPMGPFLVTRDEIPDPQRIELACFVNGERMQHGNTADMLFPVARLIEHVSRFMTLEPGDVLATGTPAGIGAFRKPPLWLQPGDVVRVESPALGVLETRIA